MKRSPNRPARFRAELRRQPVGRVKLGEWTGRFVNAPRPAEWSVSSTLKITVDDWKREWPRLADALRGDTLDVLKRDASGDVMAATITLAGRPIEIILKRPLEKYWYRRLTSLWRQARARRAWERARQIRIRGVAVEPPLAVFERRTMGVVAEAVAVFERVSGDTLEHVNLDAMKPTCRQFFFRRCGRLLRRLENTGLAHTDAKSSNWIVFNSSTAGPLPVLIDVYGVRWLNPWLQLFGLHRLLRAMKNHPQYTPADSLAICQGFAPHGTPAVESEPEPEEPADAD